MRKSIKKLICAGLLFSCALTVSACSNNSKQLTTHHISTHQNVKVKHHSNKMPMAMNDMKTTKAVKGMPMNVDYKRPSEPRPYPKHLSVKNNRILVSIKQQRGYIQQKQGKQWKTIYGMYVSTGKNGRTPRGHFHINGVKTKWFYDAKEDEGAQYASGWNQNGVYLFHTTPANKHHQVFKNIAKQLGKKPTSYGCIHLTIPDAKYIYYHAPTNMPVIIK